ncbi:uncharacterized protein LOC110332962 [Mus pahari]|uniref:uncharacterized protein LOC110332962 n=1 Tax=Mus pahari TaxID=10093 RepID=UPI000A309222|nr:uncharacterized protein LOC110332962 [Mus pahari]
MAGRLAGEHTQALSAGAPPTGRSRPGADSWKLHSAAVGGCAGPQPESGRSSLAVRPARYVHQTLGELPSDVKQLWANGTAGCPEGRGTKDQPSPPSPPPPRVSPGGAQRLPGGQVTTPFQLPLLGHQRERNLGLLCDPPTRRCLEVLPVRSGHLCWLRGLWTPVAQRAFSFRNRKSKLTRTRTHRHKRTRTTRTCSDLYRTTATDTETHPRPLTLETTAVSWSNREVAINKPRNTQKHEERNAHKRSCGDMECGLLRHGCPHPVLQRIPLRALLLGLGYPGPLWPISPPTVLPLVDDVNIDSTIPKQAVSHFAVTLATVKWSSATSKALQTGAYAR